jgi:hypothetical protein
MDKVYTITQCRRWCGRPAPWGVPVIGNARVVTTLGPGFPRNAGEPMNQSNPSNEEAIGDQLVEEISQIKQISLGEGAAECEVCGENLREGDALVAFAFRPGDRPTFQIAHVKCTDCRHEPTEYVTLGVRELVLDGRVGTCSDQATQSSWPVLLSPQPRAVSPADATTIQPLPGTAWFRRPIARSDVYTAADRVSSHKPWQRPVIRADNTDPVKDTTPHEPADTRGGAR